MRRTLLAGLAALLMISCLGGPTVAEPPRPKSVKDPVEAAFSLPPGIDLTTERREAVQKVRQQHEGDLRAALDKLAAAKDERARRVAVKDVARIRQDIQKELANLVGDQRVVGPGGKPRGWAYNEAWYPMWHPYYGPVYYPVLEPYWYPDPVVVAPRPVVPKPTPAPAVPSAYRQINPGNRNPAEWQKIKR